MPEKRDFLVTWTIDALGCKGPKAAARHALEAQRDPNSIATYFIVEEKSITTGMPNRHAWVVDLGGEGCTPSVKKLPVYDPGVEGPHIKSHGHPALDEGGPMYCPVDGGEIVTPQEKDGRMTATYLCGDFHVRIELTRLRRKDDQSK